MPRHPAPARQSPAVCDCKRRCRLVAPLPPSARGSDLLTALLVFARAGGAKRKQAERAFHYDAQTLDLLLALHDAATAPKEQQKQFRDEAARLIRAGVPITEYERSALADLLDGTARPGRGAPIRVSRREKESAWSKVTWARLRAAEHLTADSSQKIFESVESELQKDWRTVETWYGDVERCAALAEWRARMLQSWRNDVRGMATRKRAAPPQ